MFIWVLNTSLCSCKYQEVTNVSFSEKFTSVLNECSLKTMIIEVFNQCCLFQMLMFDYVIVQCESTNAQRLISCFWLYWWPETNLEHFPTAILIKTSFFVRLAQDLTLIGAKPSRLSFSMYFLKNPRSIKFELLRYFQKFVRGNCYCYSIRNNQHSRIVFYLSRVSTDGWHLTQLLLLKTTHLKI